MNRHVIAFLLLIHLPVLITQLAFLQPEKIILYQDQDIEINLCVQHGSNEICGSERWDIYPKVYCDIFSHTGVNARGVNKRRFHYRVILVRLTPGVYTFFCRMNEEAFPSRMSRIVLADSRRFLDCSGWPTMLDWKRLRGAIHICCLRPVMPTEWLRHMLDPVDICDDPGCTANDEAVLTTHGWLRFHPNKRLKHHVVLVRCHKGEFTENLYLYDSLSEQLQIKYDPPDSVIFSRTTPVLKVCLVNSKESNCLSDNSQPSTTECTLTELAPTDNTLRRDGKTQKALDQMRFTNSINLALLREGTYKIDCNQIRLSLHSDTIIHILHHGQYEWSCLDAPNVIYLSEINRQWKFCKWIFSGPEKWSKKFQSFGLLTKPFRCVIKPPGLVFHNGKLNLDRKKYFVRAGIYEVHCADELVKKNWIVANTPEDLYITVFPLAGVVNRSTEGNLFAYVSWRKVSSELQDRLNREFSITCKVRNPELPKAVPLIFNRSMKYQALSKGLIRISCESPELKLSMEPVHKLVVGHPRPQNVHPVVGQFAQALQESDSCERLKVMTDWEQGSVWLKLFGWDSQRASHHLCPDEIPGAVYHFHVKELYLAAEPYQNFYLFDQHPHVQISLRKRGGTPYEQSLLERIEATWEAVNPNGEKIPLLKIQETGVVHNFVSFSVPKSRLVAGEHLYEYHSKSRHLTLETRLTIIFGTSMRLSINGLNKKFHFAGESHTYTCVLEGLESTMTSPERYKARWKSLIPGKHVTEEQNILRLTPNSTLGLHNYRCYYKQNGIDLYQDVLFTIVERSKIRLDLNFFGNKSFVYDMQQVRPFIRCESSHIHTISQSPTWRSLRKDVQFSSYDHSDYISGKSDLFVTDTRPGVCTFQCVEQVQDYCLSRLVVFWRMIHGLEASFSPRQRTFLYNSNVSCEENDITDTRYRRRMRLVSDSYGELTTDEQVAKWTGPKLFVDIRVVQIQCNVKAFYMGQEQGKARAQQIAEVKIPLDVKLKPEKNFYKVGETVKCVPEGLIKEQLKKATLYLLDAPAHMEKFSTHFTFPRNFKGGRHRWECVMSPPYNDPKIFEGWFDFFGEGKFLINRHF
ncbi:hypothetical protein FGIG_08591 [Fasciola gigantica]|uniref:Ig-like domain-containing protein n=1 Tax=Fasciola gigantica TaxID=46835 RepID=A0A504Z0X7_FASGI|nr:hypothetical protein FGIG_08591 [Fasciola gigantica]